METTDNARLRIVRKAMKKTQNEIADVIKMARQSYGNLEKGRVRIQEKHLELLKMEFPEVNTDYIRTGQGDPLLPLGNPPINIGDSPTMYQSEPKNDLFSFKPPPATPLPIPVIYQQPPTGLTYSDLMPEATEHESIPSLNGAADFKTVITDHALDGTEYAYGRYTYIMIQDPAKADSWGVVHQVGYKRMVYTRILQKHEDQNRYPEDEYVVLRAAEKQRDRYQDMTVRRSEITFIGVSVGDMGLNVLGFMIRDKAA